MKANLLFLIYMLSSCFANAQQSSETTVRLLNKNGATWEFAISSPGTGGAAKDPFFYVNVYKKGKKISHHREEWITIIGCDTKTPLQVKMHAIIHDESERNRNPNLPYYYISCTTKGGENSPESRQEGSFCGTGWDNKPYEISFTYKKNEGKGDYVALSVKAL